MALCFADHPPLLTGFPPLIVAGLPALFVEFGGQCFTLLWRGIRGLFGGRNFHRRCDDYAPTLTLIEDKKGEHFQWLHAGLVGVTKVERESRTREQQMERRSESEEFSFSAEESAQFPGKESCAEGQKEIRSNRL
jgi:hypothetical protein